MNQHGGFMRRVFGSVTTAAALAGLLSTALPAAAATVSIDLSTQRMHVEGAGGARYDWPISSAREGYVTPTRSFQAERFAAVYHSKKYDNAPMPHARICDPRHEPGAPPRQSRLARLRAIGAAERDQALQPDAGRGRHHHDLRLAPRSASVNAAVNAGGVQRAGGLLSILGL